MTWQEARTIRIRLMGWAADLRAQGLRDAEGRTRQGLVTRTRKDMERFIRSLDPPRNLITPPWPPARGELRLPRVEAENLQRVLGDSRLRDLAAAYPGG